MKKTISIIVIFVIIAALFLLYRHHSASTSTNFVREAVVEAQTVERIRTLLTDSGIKVQAEVIVVPEGAFHAFPPGSYKISVPQDAQEKALALIRVEVQKGKYWIQAGPALDTIDPPHADSKATATNP